MEKQGYVHVNRFFSFSGHCPFDILCVITSLSYVTMEQKPNVTNVENICRVAYEVSDIVFPHNCVREN